MVYIPEGDYVTPTRAAEMLGVGTTRVWQLVKQGKLEAIEGDGIKLIPVEGIENRIQELKKREEVAERRKAVRAQIEKLKRSVDEEI